LIFTRKAEGKGKGSVFFVQNRPGLCLFFEMVQNLSTIINPRLFTPAIPPSHAAKEKIKLGNKN
jgi:hypothetical protein